MELSLVALARLPPPQSFGHSGGSCRKEGRPAGGSGSSSSFRDPPSDESQALSRLQHVSPPAALPFLFCSPPSSTAATTQMAAVWPRCSCLLVLILQSWLFRLIPHSEPWLPAKTVINGTKRLIPATSTSANAATASASSFHPQTWAATPFDFVFLQSDILSADEHDAGWPYKAMKSWEPWCFKSIWESGKPNSCKQQWLRRKNSIL